ncbi:acetylornithine deacetylase [Marinobacter sp. X15-166B]|uniref:acetylornithine deacetylase n=1 Tax=Marinobacter sp. X15-166B TaxID=1897620 RepID=UPI00085C4B59|nr:acetylornithine deacetylase [Marinobacter sp. X15-166B]OEY65740.1 acetylornithine deacetylase [Marinobacter sp. X15-166B]
MRKLLSTLLVWGLIAYAAFKGGVWWLADRGLEEARLALASEGVLARGTIGSSVAGGLTLSAPSYQPFRLTQAFHADRLTYTTDSPLALLMALWQPHKLPASWHLEAMGASLQLDAAMFRNWVTATDSEAPNLFAPVCGPDHRQRLGSGDLVRLGITEITGEAILAQTPAGLHAELSTAGSGSIELDWPGARLSLPGFAELQVSSAQPLTLTLRDGGVMRKVAAYCARESGVAVNEWTRIVMDAFREGLQNSGYAPSEQLQALYRQWLTEGGEVVVQLRPQALLYGVAVAPAAEDGVEWPVSYNGARVPGVFLRSIEPTLQATPAEAREPVVMAAAAASGEGPGWVAAEPGQAAHWAGYRVRVTLSSGRVAVGRLETVTETHLEVARMVDGGEVTYPLAIRAVTGFEVWRRNHRL